MCHKRDALLRTSKINSLFTHFPFAKSACPHSVRQNAMD